MSISDKSAIRPNTGSKLRLRAKKPRQKFLETDVTEAERDEILDYCLENKISVSQFLAEVILEDATNAKNRKNISHKIRLAFSEEVHQKLELLVHLQGKKSVAELIYDLIQPHLDLQRIHGQSEARILRFYLSDREHEIVVKYLARIGTTARKYVSFLAIQKIATSQKSRRK